MKKIAFSLFFLFLLVPIWAQSFTDLNSKIREQIDLTGQWSFKADPDNMGEAAKWYHEGFDLTSWPTVRMPAGFDQCGPGMERYFGSAWFCRQISVPESFKGRRILLHFEGINYNARVWVNGHFVGENHDAFLPFDFLINEAVKIGGHNSIAVLINNVRMPAQFPLFEGWYGQGGFLREASIVATNEIYITESLMVADPVMSAQKHDRGYLSIHAKVNNISLHDDSIKLQARVFDMAGKVLSTLLSAPASAYANQKREILLDGEIPDVVWWSPDSPALYLVELSVIQNNRIIDQVYRRTGFRKIEVQDARIRVNGEPIYLLGFNRHEDSPRTGMAVDLQQAREDFYRMKSIGCNYVRFCHYPHHTGELDLCDELGLYVLAENAMNEWGHIDHPAPNPAIPLEPEDAPRVIENAKRTLTKMVARDNHHPSIIIWSVSNENEESRQDVSTGNSELILFGQSIDQSRPWTHVSNSFRKANAESFYRNDDVIVVNVYPTHWYTVSDADVNAGLPESTKIMEATLKKIHDWYPEKPIVVGEYGFPDGDTGEVGARKQSVATEAEFKGLHASYVAGGGLWCYARHPWPWNNVSNYGYVSRDRQSAFPAFMTVEHLFKNYKMIYQP